MQNWLGQKSEFYTEIFLVLWNPFIAAIWRVFERTGSLLGMKMLHK